MYVTESFNADADLTLQMMWPGGLENVSATKIHRFNTDVQRTLTMQINQLHVMKKDKKITGNWKDVYMNTSINVFLL